MENGDLFHQQEEEPTYAEAFPPLVSSSDVGVSQLPVTESSWPIKSIPMSSVTQVRCCSMLCVYMYVCTCMYVCVCVHVCVCVFTYARYGHVYDGKLVCGYISSDFVCCAHGFVSLWVVLLRGMPA